jgi:hypothetical protein
METIAVAAARASRWAALFVCSLCFVTPCAAGPFVADANGLPYPGVVATLPVMGDPGSSPSADVGEPPYAPTRVIGTIEDVDVAANGAVEDVVVAANGVERAAGDSSGDSLLRGDSFPRVLDSLLDQGNLVPGAEKTYRALPGMAGTSPVLVAGPAPSPARDGSPELTWRETGFNVMRWTSAALAVLAVVGIVLVLVMPELRRRLFFPDLPPMPPRPA